MQVKIGNGGSNPVGIRLGGGNGSVLQSITGSSDWLYIAGIAILIIIVVALVALAIREYYRQKKKAA